MKTNWSAAVLAATLSLGLVPAASAETTWTLYTYVPAATLAPAKHWNRIAETLDKETKGEFKLKMHLAGSLPISATTITPAVSDGVVQMGDDGFFQGNVPITGIMRLPMLIATEEEFEKAAAVMRPYFEKAYDKKGTVVLGYYHYPQQVPFTKKPTTSLADLKGQKLRVTSPEQGEFVKRMGGVPITIGAAEVPSALDRGVVEGVFTASSGGGKIWKDLVAHNYRLGTNYFDAVVVANKDAFAKLAPDLQARIKQLIAEASPMISNDLKTEEEDVKGKLGLTVTEAKADDMAMAAKTMAPYWDEWAKSKGPEAVEALGKVRAAIGR